MTIDIVAMTKDRDFLALPADEQRQLILTARQRNETGAFSAPAAPPGTFPWGGGTTGVSSPEEAAASVQAMRDRVARGVADQPPSDLTIDIEKESPAAAHWTTGLIDPLSTQATDLVQAEIKRPAPLPVPPEAAIAAIPGMAGYALGARVAPLLGAAGKVVPPLLSATGGYLGRQTNVALGYEQPGTAGDVAAAALPLAVQGGGAALSAAGPLLRLASKLGGRGGAAGTMVGGLLYGLMGDAKTASLVGGSVAGLKLLLDAATTTPWGRKTLARVLSGGRQLAGPELSALLQVGRVKLGQRLSEMQQAGLKPDTWDAIFPATASDAP